MRAWRLSRSPAGAAAVLLLAAVTAQAHIENDGPDSDIRPADGTVIALQGSRQPVTARFRGECANPTYVHVDFMVVQEPGAHLERDGFTCAAGVWTWRGHLRGLTGSGQVTLVLDFEQWAGGELAEHHFHGRDATWRVEPAAAVGR